MDPDYVRTLEDQIAVLKEELAQAQCSKPFTLSSDVTRDELISEQNRTASSVAIPPNMTTAIEDVSALIWRMSIDNNGDASFIGPSGNFCFPVKHWEAADVRREKIAVATPGDTMSKPSGQVLESDQVDDHLIDLFARFVNPVQQFVDPETLSQLRGDALSSGLRLVKTAALAAGALFADDPQSRALGEDECLPAHAVSFADLATAAFEIGSQANVSSRLLFGLFVVLAQVGDGKSGDFGKLGIEGSR